MLSRIRKFFKRDSGLVAVEWVALTSGLVIGAIIIGVTVMDETQQEAEGIADGIQNDGCDAALSAFTTTYGVAC